jgi:ParB family transcriptional regulator, chromosome partitioning protein
MRRALGKGLSQLIAEQFDDTPSEVPVDAIVPNERQPRTHFNSDALEELAQSIRRHGILQPLAVRPISEGRYELIAGERRLRAAKLAGLKTVPIVLRSATNRDSLELALIENIQREDINPMECARAYSRLMTEFDLTQEQVAERVGKSRTAIANTLRLNRLPRRIQNGIEGEAISEGHARALLGFHSEAEQLAVYDQILQRGMTVREVERLSKPKAVSTPKAEAGTPEREDPNWQALQEALATYFGSPVKLCREPVGGKITIQFYSDDDLDRLMEILGLRL